MLHTKELTSSPAAFVLFFFFNEKAKVSTSLKPQIKIGGKQSPKRLSLVYSFLFIFACVVNL